MAFFHEIAIKIAMLVQKETITSDSADMRAVLIAKEHVDVHLSFTLQSYFIDTASNATRYALSSIVYLYRRLLATLMKTAFALSWEIRPRLGKYLVKIEYLTLLRRVAGFRQAKSVGK